MKLAFCTEGRVDEEVLRILISRLRATPVVVHKQQYRIELGGWTKALQQLLYGTDQPDTELALGIAAPIAEQLSLDALATASSSFQAFAGSTGRAR